MIFLDTGFLFALFVEGDVNHERVQEVFGQYRGRRLDQVLMTTNHVVGETVTLLGKRGHPNPRIRHELAVMVGEQLFGGTLGQIHRTTEEEEHEAIAYLKKYADQDYSFVDCLSFVVMEKHEIREAWAVDSDFTHRFITRPGPA